MGCFRIVSATVLFLAIGVDAAQAASLPAVYEDGHVTISAGVEETGQRPIHLGDALTLVVEIEFDPGDVRIETLDGDYFQRTFSGVESVKLLEVLEPGASRTEDGRTRVSAGWQFQILACPAEKSSCPGSRSYDLPLMNVAYQLADEAGKWASERSARFRPWPGRVEVSPAVTIPRPDKDEPVRLAKVIPGGAYPAPKSVHASYVPGAVLLVAGGLFLLSAFFAGSSTTEPERLLAGTGVQTRWRRAAAALDNGSLDDDEWFDLLRRCIAWHCMDEYGHNPYSYIAGDFHSPDTRLMGLQALFGDILVEDGMNEADRRDLLSRFRLWTATGS